MTNFQFGDIIRGRKTNHPIIFLSSKNDDQFHGGIITHASAYDNNIAMLQEHFKEQSIEGVKFMVQYDKTYFVKLKLCKLNDWGPFKKEGELTSAGIKFVEDEIKEKHQIYWRDYIQKQRGN